MKLRRLIAALVMCEMLCFVYPLESVNTAAAASPPAESVEYVVEHILYGLNVVVPRLAEMNVTWPVEYELAPSPLSTVTSYEHEIEDFPLIWQMPELPTGCEITALTMVLQYYGYDVSKTTMASWYLPTTYARLYYDSDGNLYGPDINEYFIGDPFSETGIICGTGAITTAADEYLADHNGYHYAIDLNGASPEELYDLVAQDVPVIVWVTIGMMDRDWTEGWYTDYGEYVDWSTNDHGAVLIGYTEDTVIIADPISGYMEYDRPQFEAVFESRGRRCVILIEDPEEAA